MNDIINKILNFMYGRYQMDELYKFIITLCLIIIIINIFLHSTILDILALALLTIATLRYLSKNKTKRRKENQKYLQIKQKITKLYNYYKQKYKDRNTHTYRRCKKCKQKIRLPLKKGIHKVKCPNCGTYFTVKCNRNEKIKVEIVK